MDLDTYLATHRPEWERLAKLTKGGRRHVRRMSDAELAELVHLYQAASASLSYVRSYYRDPGLISYLTTLVSSSGALIYSTPSRTWRAFKEFFVVTFPSAVWRIRRFVAISFALLMIPAVAAAIWIGNSDRARDAAIPPALQETYVNREFEEYYRSEEASQFATDVFVNNAQIAVMAFASGLLLGLPVLYILVFNGASIGMSAGLFAHYGQLDKWFGLILPHGLLELSAVIVAGATGLYMGWSLIAPGDRSRDTALREEGRRIITIVLGLILTLFVSGIIEGFVTGQPWATWIRVAIGSIVEIAFIAYIVILGRRGEALGYTGALGETDEQGWAKAPELKTA